MSTTAKPKWYCDPRGYVHGDCVFSGCRGHIPTKDMLLAADVLAWHDGENDLAGVADEYARQEYLDMAGEFISERGKR